MLTETSTTAPAPTVVELPATLPITESQKGLLVVDGWVPTKEIYNQIIRMDLDPALDEDAVVRALPVLIAVQPAMRQVFHSHPHLHATLSPAQLAGAPDFPLETVHTSAEAHDQDVAALAARMGSGVFDLATGPVYRFGLVRATDGSTLTVILCAHHIVGDGVSVGPFVRDLDAILTGALAADAVAAKVEEREKAFLKELAAQARAAGSDTVTDRAKVWAEQLRAVAPLVLSPRPSRPNQTAFAGARVSMTLDERETEALQATCKRLGITPFVLLTAVYGTTVARHGGVDEVLVGSPFVARRTIKAFDLCGFFVNTLPVSVRVDWERTVDEHLGQVVKAAVDHCRSHVDVTFNQLVAHVQPDRSSNRNPLFSCMLAMQDTFDPKDAGAVRKVSEPGNHTAKFDLWLGATPVDGRWLLELEYDVELIAPAVADGLLGSLRTALRRTLADGSLRLADLFDDDSAVQSLRTDGYPAPLGGATLTEWFERVAARIPDAVAIEDAAGRLTYGELDGVVATVAGGLAAQGVRPGDVVGLVLDNLSDTTAAIMAVLRIGAAYLPLDRTLPLERISYMAERAGCGLVVGDAIVPGAARRRVRRPVGAQHHRTVHSGRERAGVRHVHLRLHRQAQGRADGPRPAAEPDRLADRRAGDGRADPLRAVRAARVRRLLPGDHADPAVRRHRRLARTGRPPRLPRDAPALRRHRGDAHLPAGGGAAPVHPVRPRQPGDAARPAPLLRVRRAAAGGR